jgi:hypothetical protein
MKATALRVGIVTAAAAATTLFLPLASASASSANIVADGDFSVPPSTPGTYTTYCVAAEVNCPTPSTTFGPWTLTSGSVDVYTQTFYPGPTSDPNFPSDAAAQSVDIDGGEPGTIQETLGAVTAGTAYNVSFELNGNICVDASANKSLTLALTDTSLAPQQFTYLNGGTPGTAWEQETFSFTPTAAGTPVLSISSNTPGDCGAMIADIDIEPVPVVGSPVAAPVIAGPAAAVLAAGGVVWFVRRRRNTADPIA